MANLSASFRDYFDAVPDLRASEKEGGKNKPMTIYPVYAALGLSVSDTLLVNCHAILVEGESDQLYLSALKNYLISKGKIKPLREMVFIPTGGVRGIKATAAILSSGNNNAKPLIVLDGDTAGKKMENELRTGMYADEPAKLIMINKFSETPDAEIEDLFPKDKFAKLAAKFLPRPEDAEEEFDDFVTEDRPICNQIEEFARNQGINQELGWKVHLAKKFKRELLKGSVDLIDENDPEFNKILELFNLLVPDTPKPKQKKAR